VIVFGAHLPNPCIKEVSPVLSRCDLEGLS
jgi:hypothetical protein